MKINGAIALVTGANRGLGRSYVEQLLAMGAVKVYAGARDPASVNLADPRVVPVRLDVTSEADIAAAARDCPDVTLLVNNAGQMLYAPVMAENAASALRQELDVNAFGLLAMSQAFAPILARNGGGAILNMLSIVSWFVAPGVGTYSASKYAALAINEGLRTQLKAQGTQVTGVYAGFIDTDMVSRMVAAQGKTPPADIARAALEGLEAGLPHVTTDARSRQVWQALREDPMAMANETQAVWDKRTA